MCSESSMLSTVKLGVCRAAHFSVHGTPDHKAKASFHRAPGFQYCQSQTSQGANENALFHHGQV